MVQNYDTQIEQFEASRLSAFSLLGDIDLVINPLIYHYCHDARERLF